MVTDAGTHEADVLVIALGADYDMDATPGLAEAGNEFYSVAGAERLAGIIPSFSRGHAVIGICGAPFKCPPAPSECALMLDDELTARGVRDACEISIVMPLGTPVPPSPETSAALEREFAARDIKLLSGRRVAALDPLAQPGCARRRQRAALRPVPRRPQASRAGRGDRERHDRGWLHTRRLRHAGDAVSGRLCGRGRRDRGSPEGRRLRGGRRPRRRADDRRPAAEAASRPNATSGGAPATSSSVRDVSAASTSTSSPARPKRARSTPPSAEQMAEKERFGSSRRARWFGA